jgi:hypothetical protein
MKSTFPEYAVAITGLPRYMASAIARPNPVARCSETYTSAAPSNRRA